VAEGAASAGWSAPLTLEHGAEGALGAAAWRGRRRGLAGAGTETWCGSDTAECSALGVLKSVLVVGGRIACMVVVMVI
jgi:hypothetical protein